MSRAVSIMNQLVSWNKAENVLSKLILTTLMIKQEHAYWALLVQVKNNNKNVFFSETNK